MRTNIYCILIKYIKEIKLYYLQKQIKMNKNINLQFMDCVKQGMDCETCGITL